MNKYSKVCFNKGLDNRTMDKNRFETWGCKFERWR